MYLTRLNNHARTIDGHLSKTFLDLKYPNEPDRDPYEISFTFRNDGIYSFVHLFNFQPGTLKPRTAVMLRQLLQYSGLVHQAEPQQPWDSVQFNIEELSCLLYLLLENLLKPEFYRVVFIPFSTIQQLSYLVIYRTTQLMYQCIRAQYEHQPMASSHFGCGSQSTLPDFSVQSCTILPAYRCNSSHFLPTSNTNITLIVPIENSKRGKDHNNP